MSQSLPTSLSASALDELCVSTLRFLAVDAVQKADSGHPGLPLDAAPMAYVLWTRFLKHHHSNPAWLHRDRFVLSAGHGSMLLYSLLHVTGYDFVKSIRSAIDIFHCWQPRRFSDGPPSIFNSSKVCRSALSKEKDTCYAA